MARIILCAIGIVAPVFAGATELQQRLDKADGHIRNGRPTEALALLEEAVKKNPSSLEAHVRYQDVMRSTGKLDQILPEYRARAKDSPRNVRARYLYARLRKGRQAVGEFRAVVKLDEGFAPGWIGYSRALRSAGSAKEAVKAAKRALKLDIERPEAHDALGWAMEGLGLDPMQEYRSALQLDENYLPARFKLAYLLAQSEDTHEQAILEIEGARKIAPGDPRVYIHKGLVLGALERNQEAGEAYRKAVAMAPADPLILVLLAESYAELSQWDLADRAVRRALDLDEALPEAHAAAGYAALRRGRLTEAVAEFKRAIKLDGKAASHHYYLGFAHEKSGRFKEAATDYKNACKLDKDNSEYQLALAIAYAEQGKVREALAAYREATRISPEDPQVWASYAHGAADARKHKESVKAFRKAIDLDPGDLELWKNLGIVYETGLSNEKEAAACYRTYVDGGGKDVRVAEWLAELEGG